MINKNWPSEEEIKKSAETRRRRWSCFDLSTCKHEENAFVRVGDWGLLICVACGQSTSKECLHSRCEWNTAGTLLRCTNCGIDGT